MSDVKLSERIRSRKREYLADADDLGWDGFERARLSQVADGLEEAAAIVEQHELQLESTNAELTKRVAESEARLVGLTPKYIAWLQAKSSEVPGLTATLDEARGHNADLQAKLAWTPVSAGLPTEPGLYEFLYRDCHDGSSIHLYELDAEVGFCVGNTGHPIWFSLDSRYNYTHYRRIELPKDGES